MHRNRIKNFLDNDNTPARALARYKISSSLEEHLYATTDANHNVTSIDDVFGAVKERFVYDPYRNSTVLTSAWASTSDSYSWIDRSQGQREDATTNTIDSRNRVYGLGVGRWMQADNIGGYVDGANRYQFVKSSPISHLDPPGLYERKSGTEALKQELTINGETGVLKVYTNAVFDTPLEGAKNDPLDPDPPGIEIEYKLKNKLAPLCETLHWIQFHWFETLEGTRQDWTWKNPATGLFYKANEVYLDVFDGATDPYYETHGAAIHNAGEISLIDAPSLPFRRDITHGRSTYDSYLVSEDNKVYYHVHWALDSFFDTRTRKKTYKQTNIAGEKVDSLQSYAGPAKWLTGYKKIKPRTLSTLEDPQYVDNPFK